MYLVDSASARSKTGRCPDHLVLHPKSFQLLKASMMSLLKIIPFAGRNIFLAIFIYKCGSALLLCKILFINICELIGSILGCRLSQLQSICNNPGLDKIGYRISSNFWPASLNPPISLLLPVKKLEKRSVPKRSLKCTCERPFEFLKQLCRAFVMRSDPSRRPFHRHREESGF